MPILNERIREMRKARGMTLEELGKKIGVGKQTIQKYETNVITNIPSDRIEAIAKAVKCSPAYLMGWQSREEELEHDQFLANIQGSLNQFLSQEDINFVLRWIETPEGERKKLNKILEICNEGNEDFVKRVLMYAEKLAELHELEKMR